LFCVNIKIEIFATAHKFENYTESEPYVNVKNKLIISCTAAMTIIMIETRKNFKKAFSG
jgi:hypothetical protein